MQTCSPDECGSLELSKINLPLKFCLINIIYKSSVMRYVFSLMTKMVPSNCVRFVYFVKLACMNYKNIFVSQSFVEGENKLCRLLGKFDMLRYN